MRTLCGHGVRVANTRNVARAITTVKGDRVSKEPEQREFIQSLERGLAVILAFSDHHPSLTLSRCAELTGLSRPTVRRVLLTLQQLGYVRSEGRSFALTPRVLALGYAYLSSLNLPVIASTRGVRANERP